MPLKSYNSFFIEYAVSIVRRLIKVMLGSKMNGIGAFLILLTRYLYLIMLFLILTSIHLHADNKWIIDPGHNWGPINLNMTEENVILLLGHPLDSKTLQTTTGKISKFLYFQNASLLFIQQQKGSSPKLYQIIIRDKQSSTKEGIRIGSSIFDVINIYGEYIKANRVKDKSGYRILRCMEINIHAFPMDRFFETGSPDSLILDIYYRNLGIGFDINLSKKPIPWPPQVENIRIQEPQACLED